MLLCLVVVVLGAWVRLTDAGLGCPDWPGCYGHVTPAGAEKTEGKIESYSPGWEYDSGKAWREMIHRYAATALGLIIVLAIAVVVLTFNSFRLTVVAFLAAGLSAGLSLLSLALFNYPFGITAIIGLIGSIGVSINAALIVLSA
ncbi:MAG: COX15/CtaA family protein, partial [bacterium]